MATVAGAAALVLPVLAGSTSAAALETLTVESAVQVNFEGDTSDSIDTTVTGPFDELLEVSVPSPESDGTASAESWFSGSATDALVTLSAGGGIGNFAAAGGSSASSFITATAVYVIDTPTPFTLEVPGGIVAGDTSVGAFGSQEIGFFDADEQPVPVAADGLSATVAVFGMNLGDSSFQNGDGTLAAGTVLTGMLEPGTYTLRYDAEMFGTGGGSYSISGLVVAVPEPSTATTLGLATVLIACRRRRG